MSTTGRNPFAARAATAKAAGRGRLRPRNTPGGSAGPQRHGVAGGHLAWTFVPGFPTLQWAQADVPPTIQTYDAVLVLGRNWDAFPTEGNQVAQFDWHGAELDSAWTTQPGTYVVPPFGVPDGLWTAWASIGLGFMLTDGPGDLELAGTHSWPQLGGGGYPDGEAQYVVLAFPSAWRNIAFVGPDAAAGFAGEGFWGGDFLGPVVPSWSWSVPPGTQTGLSQPYFIGTVGGQPYAPAAGVARVLVAFTHTGEANHLTSTSYQGWAVEFSDFDFVVLSRPYADELSVTLPAAAGVDASRFVTSYWAGPGGGWERPAGKLKGRPHGKLAAFEHELQQVRRRNPFA